MDKLDPQNQKLRDLKNGINKAHTRYEAAGAKSIDAAIEIGNYLIEAKETLKDRRGAFGKWATAHFKFSKVWRAKLMKLAEHEDSVKSILADRETAPEHRSVKGVLDLLAKHQREAMADAVRDAEAEPATSKPPREGTKQWHAQKAERLETELETARREIRDLQRQNAELRRKAGASGPLALPAPKPTETTSLVPLSH